MNPRELKPYTLGPEDFYSNEESHTVFSPEQVADAIESAMNAAHNFAFLEGNVYKDHDYYLWNKKLSELRNAT